MSLVLRIGRWSLTVFAIAVDDLYPDDEPDRPGCVSGSLDIAPGFTPPDRYWQEEEEE